MAIINPDGLFGGDRLRHCSNAAQLHWPRLFLASNGFGRIELNYNRIVGRAYATFRPVPAEKEILGCIQEYLDNFLLFGYVVDGQAWGQWDTPGEFLPRYKTAADKRSPVPPEPAFSEWKRLYRQQSKTLPKSFGTLSETFLRGVGVGGGVGVGNGDGKNTCSTPQNGVELESAENFNLITQSKKKPLRTPDGLTDEQRSWFESWWVLYWRKVARVPAMRAFGKHVRTAERFADVMDATLRQTPEMLSRDPSKRPHGATWINGSRWEDPIEESTEKSKQSVIDGALAIFSDAAKERDDR